MSDIEARLRRDLPAVVDAILADRATTSQTSGIAYDSEIRSARSATNPAIDGEDRYTASELADERRYRTNRPRWLLSAAAATILISGVAALVTLADSRPEADVAVTAPAAVTAPPVVDAEQFRFADPLASGVVPYLDPAPAQPEFIERREAFDWVSGIERFTLFGVEQEDGVTAGVVVVEMAARWDLISEGLEVETVNNNEAVVVRPTTQTGLFARTGLFIKNGEATRAVFDLAPLLRDEAPPLDVSSEARQVARLVAGESLDDIALSDPIVQVDAFGVGSAVVTYGSPSETVLIRATIPASMGADELAVTAQLVSGFSLTEPPQSLAFERVSPTDLIVAGAATQDLADEALATVQFDERSDENVPSELEIYDQVGMRGEPSWGRWELATSSTDPTCWKFAATVWDPAIASDEATSCRDAGATETIPTAFCLRMGDRIIGALLDSNAAPDFQSPSGVENLDTTIEETNDTISFQVRNTNGNPGGPDVEITVDGTPLNCSI